MTAVYDFPVSLRKFNVEGVDMKNYRAVYREDTNQPLTIVSDRYNLTKHADIIDKVQPLISGLGKYEEKHNLIKDGAKLVSEYTFKDITAEVKARKINDVVALRINVINSYDRSTSIEINVAAMVLKCLNGATIPQGYFSIGVRHIKNAIEMIELPEANALVRTFQRGIGTFSDLANVEATEERKQQVQEIAIKRVVLGQRAFEKYPEQFTKAENMWELYNAYTWVLTHQSRNTALGRIQRLDRLNLAFNEVVGEPVTH